MQADKLKKLSIQIMIGGLIGAAGLAVIAVLAGSFSDTFGKALGSLILVMFHALASLAFLDRNLKDGKRDFKFFENVFFSVIVLSFFTSILGVWNLLDGDIVGKLYGTYGIVLFASLHGQMLTETTGKQSNIDSIVAINYLLMCAVILMILPIIWIADSSSFPNFYYRLLAALGIVDATLTILAVILHRMYIQKHPQAQSAIFSVQTQIGPDGKPIAIKASEQKRHSHPLFWLLVILLGGQLAISALVAIIGAANK